MLLSYFLMIISFLLLCINGAQGYLHFKIYNATHIQFAFIATIFYMFAESWIMFYFIGSGKTIKETIIAYNLDTKIYNDVIRSKRKLFPHITINILLIGIVFVIGGGVHTKVISSFFHAGLFFIGLIHFSYLIYLQHYYFKDTVRILIQLGDLIKEK